MSLMVDQIQIPDRTVGSSNNSSWSFAGSLWPEKLGVDYHNPVGFVDGRVTAGLPISVVEWIY